jgi:uncharacterized protein (TIGR00369 family)
MTGLDRMRAHLSGEVPPPPIAVLVGFKLVAVEEGGCTFELDADGRHANPMGTLHGGVLCDLTDAAMGFAWASTLVEGETFTTLELKINFFKPVWKARLRATSRIVRKGSTVGMVECDVLDEKGSLVARASSTVMTLRGDKASGR